MGIHKRQGALILVFILIMGCSVIELIQKSKPANETKSEVLYPAGRVVTNLVRRLKAFGLEPVMENTPGLTIASNGLTYPQSLWVATTQSVMATIPGANSQGTIMLWAQYRPDISTGDSLGGNSSAAVLTLVKALKNSPPLQNDIVLFFSNVERGDGMGPWSYMPGYPMARHCDVVLKIDNIGKTGKVKLLFSSKNNYRLVHDFAQLAPQPPLLVNSTSMTPNSDQALAFIQFLGNQPLAKNPAFPANGHSVLIQPQTGVFNPLLQNIDEAIQDFMHKWEIPGGAVAISKDGRLVYARGFGFAHLETKTLVQPQHQFRIASLSKPITAVTVMKLVEAGKLGLDAFVFGPKGILSDSTYGVIRDKRMERITVRHLLEHSAGWDREKSGSLMFDPVNIAHIMRVHPPADIKSIIRYVVSRPLDFAPGSRYAYSNIGYCVLGRVIEKVTHTSYENYVKINILQPVGITHMRIGKTIPTAQEADEVGYYPALGEEWGSSIYGLDIQVPFAYGGFNLEAMDAHGGWIASAPELLRFMVAVDGYDTKPDILAAATLQLMVRPTAALQSGYGLGWWINQENNWCHTGSLPGSSALLERTNDGYCWAVLFNRRSDAAPYFVELYQLIWNGIKDIRHWPGYDLFDLPASMTTAPIAQSDSSQTGLLPVAAPLR